MKRKDAIEFKFNGDPYHVILPYVMPKRTEAEVSATENFDVTNLMNYIEKYNKENNTNIKLFHCLCYAIGKTIYHRPMLNVFISGRKFWKRNDITLSFVAKQYMADEATERLMVLKVLPEHTIKEISSIILGDVKKARSQGSNDLDKTMDIFAKMPRFVLTFVFWVLSRLEYHGIYPASLAHGDPNYTTCLISNLGSIKAGSCYHHLSNFGTNSMMVTIGMVKEDKKTKLLPMTFNLDERIADGFYFAKSLRLIKHLLANPEELFDRIDAEIDEEIFK